MASVHHDQHELSDSDLFVEEALGRVMTEPKLDLDLLDLCCLKPSATTVEMIPRHKDDACDTICPILHDCRARAREQLAHACILFFKSDCKCPSKHRYSNRPRRRVCGESGHCIKSLHLLASNFENPLLSDEARLLQHHIFQTASFTSARMWGFPEDIQIPQAFFSIRPVMENHDFTTRAYLNLHSLLARYATNRKLDYLDQVVELAGPFISSMDSAHRLFTESVLLLWRTISHLIGAYDLSGDLDTYDQAVVLGRKCHELLPLDNRRLAQYHAAFTAFHQPEFKHMRLFCLKYFATVFIRKLDRVDLSVAARAQTQQTLQQALLELIEERRTLKGLEIPPSVLRALLPPEHLHLIQADFPVLWCLLDRYERSQKPEFLNEAFEFATTFFPSINADHPLLATIATLIWRTVEHLTNLYDETNELAFLENASSLVGTCLAGLPRGHPLEYAEPHEMPTVACGLDYKHLRVGFLSRSLTIFFRELDRFGLSDSVRTQTWVAFQPILRELVDDNGSLEGVQVPPSVFHILFDLWSQEHSRLIFIAMPNLRVLLERYGRRRSLEDLDEACDLASLILGSIHHEHPLINLAVSLTLHLVNHLLDLYDNSMEHQPLLKASTIIDTCLAKLPSSLEFKYQRQFFMRCYVDVYLRESHRDLPKPMRKEHEHILQQAIFEWIEENGSLGELHIPYVMLRALRPSRHPYLVHIDTSILQSLLEQYEHSRKRDDLDEVVNFVILSFPLIDHDHPLVTKLGSLLWRTADHLLHVYDNSGQLRSLEQATDVVKTCLANLPQNHPQYANLSACLLKVQSRHAPSLVLTRKERIAVAKGGYSDVYRGEIGERAVAMKALRLDRDGSGIKSLLSEVQVWRRVKQRYILELLGTYEENGEIFVISPWCSNGHCLAYIRNHPDFNRLKLLCQVAEALEYLHAFSPLIVHGDVKAENVLIDNDGNALLCDFGLSRLERTIDITATATQVAVAGTCRFMAPELFAEEPESDEGDTTRKWSKTTKSDVYAFGCFIFQVITGEQPFSHLRYDVTVIARVVLGDRPLRPQIFENDNLWLVCTESWAQDRNSRPTMRQLLTRLRAIEATAA